MAFPLKRLAVARLQAIATGQIPPPAGTELLVSTAQRPVQVAFSRPAEPDNICIFGVPVRATFAEVTAEAPDQLTETATIGFRIRVFDIGEDEFTVDQTVGDMCTAVTTAVLTPALSPVARMWLSGMTQDAPLLAPNPDPSVTASTLLIFSAEAVAYAG